MKKTRTLTHPMVFRMPPEMRQRIDAISAETSLSVADLCRMGLQRIIQFPPGQPTNNQQTTREHNQTN